MILQGVGHPAPYLGVSYANDPKKGGYMAYAPALDLTTLFEVICSMSPQLPRPDQGSCPHWAEPAHWLRSEGKREWGKKHVTPPRVMSRCSRTPQEAGGCGITVALFIKNWGREWVRGLALGPDVLLAPSVAQNDFPVGRQEASVAVFHQERLVRAIGSERLGTIHFTLWGV